MTIDSNSIELAGAISVAVAAIFGGVLQLYRIARRIEAAIGVDRHGRTVADRLERVEHQLFPNGGSSLADRVGQLRETQISQGSELAVLRDLLTHVVERAPERSS